MLLRLVEFFTFLVMIWMVIFQILIPAFLQMKLFPAFRRSRASLENKIVAKNDKLDQQKLKDELNS